MRCCTDTHSGGWQKGEPRAAPPPRPRASGPPAGTRPQACLCRRRRHRACLCRDDDDGAVVAGEVEVVSPRHLVSRPEARPQLSEPSTILDQQQVGGQGSGWAGSRLGQAAGWGWQQAGAGSRLGLAAGWGAAGWGWQQAGAGSRLGLAAGWGWQQAGAGSRLGLAAGWGWLHRLVEASQVPALPGSGLPDLLRPLLPPLQAGGGAGGSPARAVQAARLAAALQHGAARHQVGRRPAVAGTAAPRTRRRRPRPAAAALPAASQRGRRGSAARLAAQQCCCPAVLPRCAATLMPQRHLSAPASAAAWPRSTARPPAARPACWWSRTRAVTCLGHSRPRRGASRRASTAPARLSSSSWSPTASATPGRCGGLLGGLLEWCVFVWVCGVWGGWWDSGRCAEGVLLAVVHQAAHALRCSLVVPPGAAASASCWPGPARQLAGSQPTPARLHPPAAPCRRRRRSRAASRTNTSCTARPTAWGCAAPAFHARLPFSPPATCPPRAARRASRLCKRPRTGRSRQPARRWGAAGIAAQRR